MHKAPRRSHTVLSLSILAMFAGSTTWAQETQLPQVDVVGTSPLPGIGIEREKLPYNVQTATDADVRDSQSTNLIEYMARNLNGVNINELQGSTYQVDVTYRGMRASPMLGASQGLSVYLDGVRVNEPFGDVVNWDMLPEMAFATVTLVPGSNPVYGLNTLGGALAFTTKSGLTHPGFEGSVSIGSFGRQRLEAAYGKTYEDGWHSFVSATTFGEDGWRDHSQGELGNLFMKIGRAQGDTNWDLAFLSGKSNLTGNSVVPSYSVDGGLATPGLYEARRSAVYTYPDITRNQLNQLTFNLQHMLDARTEIASTTYLRSSSRHAINGDLNETYQDGTQNLYPGTLNTANLSQTSYGSSLNLTKELERHHLTIGASVDASRIRYAQFQQDGTFNSSRGVVGTGDVEQMVDVSGKSLSMGLYASDTWTIVPGTYLTTAARFNHAQVSNTLTRFDPATSGTENFTYSKLNPSIGLSHKLLDTLQVFGNLAQSNRVPTVIELGCADETQGCRLPIGLQSDPYLKQVVSRTLEGGLRWQPDDRSTVSASTYLTLNKDDILFLKTGTGQTGYFHNFDGTRYQGLDLSANRQFGTVSVRLNYSYLHATYDANGELFYGNRSVEVKPGTRMAGLPQHTLKLGADWKATPALSLGGDLVTTSSLVSQGNEDGKIDAVNFYNMGVAGYTVVNLRTSYKADKHLEFFGRINNLFDRRYETFGMVATNYFSNNGLLDPDNPVTSRFVAPGAPRAFTIGARYKF